MKNIAEGLDWVSFKSKQDLLVLFREALSSTPADPCRKDYPHKPDAKSRLILCTKLKILRLSFDRQ